MKLAIIPILVLFVVCTPTLAFGQDAPAPVPDVSAFIAALKAHAWPIVAAFVVGFVVRLIKDDKFTVIPTPPPRFRPLVALLLGMLSGASEAVIMGTAWGPALLGGFLSALGAIGGHDVLIHSLLGGKEVSLKASGGIGGAILALLLALSQTSCAAVADYQEQVDKLEDGLKTANDIALVAERCTSDYLDTAIAACETQPLYAQAACIATVDTITEDVRRLFQAWRDFRCSLGGLGGECDPPRPSAPELPPRPPPAPSSAPSVAPPSPAAPVGEGGSGSA